MKTFIAAIALSVALSASALADDLVTIPFVGDSPVDHDKLTARTIVNNGGSLDFVTDPRTGRTYQLSKDATWKEDAVGVRQRLYTSGGGNGE